MQAACAELGYSLEQMEDFLTTGDFPEELVTLVMGKTGCQDRAAVVDKLKPQRAALLQKVCVLLCMRMCAHGCRR